ACGGYPLPPLWLARCPGRLDSVHAGQGSGGEPARGDDDGWWQRCHDQKEWWWSMSMKKLQAVSASSARRMGLNSLPRQVRGVGLLEVMISVLILSVGLLGIAAMQALALRGSQSSLESTQAVM